jgi:hypothetical protein
MKNSEGRETTGKSDLMDKDRVFNGAAMYLYLHRSFLNRLCFHSEIAASVLKKLFEERHLGNKSVKSMQFVSSFTNARLPTRIMF